MSNIKFKILPSPESNDHEVRIIIDDYDLLGNDYLGIDPPVLFDQNSFFEEGELMIGRCTCGVEGCSDFPVNVKIDTDKVTWTNDNGLKIEFEKQKYVNCITDARNDHSWEDINRRVERLVSELLNNSQTKEGYSFNWASARIKQGKITVSYSKNTDQKLLEFSWDNESTESALTNAKIFAEQTDVLR